MSTRATEIGPPSPFPQRGWRPQVSLVRALEKQLAVDFVQKNELKEAFKAQGLDEQQIAVRMEEYNRRLGGRGRSGAELHALIMGDADNPEAVVLDDAGRVVQHFDSDGQQHPGIAPDPTE